MDPGYRKKMQTQGPLYMTAFAWNALYIMDPGYRKKMQTPERQRS